MRLWFKWDVEIIGYVFDVRLMEIGSVNGKFFNRVLLSYYAIDRRPFEEFIST